MDGVNLDSCNSAADSRKNTIIMLDSNLTCKWIRKIGDSVGYSFDDLQIGNDGIFVMGYASEDITISTNQILSERHYIAKISFQGIWQWGLELPENYWEYGGAGLPMVADNDGGLSLVDSIMDIVPLLKYTNLSWYAIFWRIIYC